ncbi:hypothetical protein [Polaromonas sp.]|uniref:hypothetical protein n=1 Tax=Polaromonas sp. TaxID=1869339 RepID=UPI00352AB8F5
MQILVSLDRDGRWRWQMLGSDERALANGRQTFATYSLTFQRANEFHRWICGAPIEIEVPEMPLEARQRTCPDV